MERRPSNRTNSTNDERRISAAGPPEVIPHGGPGADRQENGGWALAGKNPALLNDAKCRSVSMQDFPPPTQKKKKKKKNPHTHPHPRKKL